MLRLVLVDEYGNVIEVCDDIDEYDLDKPFAAPSLINDLKFAISLAQKEPPASVAVR